jgi:hypothetical protein
MILLQTYNKSNYIPTRIHTNPPALSHCVPVPPAYVGEGVFAMHMHAHLDAFFFNGIEEDVAGGELAKAMDKCDNVGNGEIH